MGPVLSKEFLDIQVCDYCLDELILFKATKFSKNRRPSWFLSKCLDYLITLEYLPGIKQT